MINYCEEHLHILMQAIMEFFKINIIRRNRYFKKPLARVPTLQILKKLILPFLDITKS